MQEAWAVVTVVMGLGAQGKGGMCGGGLFRVREGRSMPVRTHSTVTATKNQDSTHTPSFFTEKHEHAQSGSPAQV